MHNTLVPFRPLFLPVEHCCNVLFPLHYPLQRGMLGIENQFSSSLFLLPLAFVTLPLCLILLAVDSVSKELPASFLPFLSPLATPLGGGAVTESRSSTCRACLCKYVTCLVEEFLLENYLPLSNSK